MEETKQWENLKSGDINALQALYNHHVSALYRYGMVLCHDEDKVKDALHDMFLSFWNNRERLTIPTSGKAYLMVSLRRRIFDKGPISTLQTIPIEEGDLDNKITLDPEEMWVISEKEEENQQKLSRAMNLISDRQREIIHMKYIQQMEYEDIARIMNLNYQSARNLVTRALAALRKEMILVFLFITSSL
jgi:RNA polymerase sigma-70 factor (ECF subfamily)